MTEPRKPGEGEPAPYTLPSWIDQAIARSKGEEVAPESPTADDDASVSEDADTAEYPAPTEPASPPRPRPSRDEADTTEVVPYFISPTIDTTEEKHVKYPTVPETPIVRAEREAATESAAPEPDSEMVEVAPERRNGALPWVIAALFLAAAALVLAYLIWMRPVPA